jgi:hypothetical protein
MTTLSSLLLASIDEKSQIQVLPSPDCQKRPAANPAGLSGRTGAA